MRTAGGRGWWWTAAGLLVLHACSGIEPSAPVDDEVLDGPVEELTYAQQAQHLAGDEAFNDEVFTAATGLGPVFVASSCGSCHAGDGKGHPSTTLTRFGQSDTTGNRFLGMGGPQLQHRALPGYEPEQIPAGAPSARFMPPINTGLGFLELVSDADILARADPADADGDGISGVPNWNTIPEYVVPRPGAAVRGGRYLCRFGKKGAVYDLVQQTASAYSQDIGITSTFEPVDVHSGLSIDPEVSDATIRDVVFYLQTLKAPIQRNRFDPMVQRGGVVFSELGCASCHTPTLRTGYSPVSALSNREIHPYSDLLLHDMGPELDDGYTEGSATTSEWRTPPLWGLGLAPQSQGGQFFLMHDGRARSIDQAIGMHGGEAARSRAGFLLLPESDRRALLAFLESL